MGFTEQGLTEEAQKRVHERRRVSLQESLGFNGWWLVGCVVVVVKHDVCLKLRDAKGM